LYGFTGACGSPAGGGGGELLRIAGLPLLWHGAGQSNFASEMQSGASHHGPRTMHLFPKADGWILMSQEKGEDGRHFPDLGRALDAATSGLAPVHVVVHERYQASAANAG